jgi:hypothetical protein
MFRSNLAPHHATYCFNRPQYLLIPLSQHPVRMQNC